MLSRNMTQNIQKMITNHLLTHGKNNLTAVDATLGNGFDLEFLNTQNQIYRIYGFDIQEQAICNSGKSVSESTKSIQLIKDSHHNIDQYVEEPIDLAMFNLGYLPGGDKEIVTCASNTLVAIQKVIDKLAVNGMLTVMTYPGHEEGAREDEQIKAYLSEMYDKNLAVLQLCVENVHKPCPKAYLIIKN